MAELDTCSCAETWGSLSSLEYYFAQAIFSEKNDITEFLTCCIDITKPKIHFNFLPDLCFVVFIGEIYFGWLTRCIQMWLKCLQALHCREKRIYQEEFVFDFQAWKSHRNKPKNWSVLEITADIHLYVLISNLLIWLEMAHCELLCSF